MPWTKWLVAYIVILVLAHELRHSLPQIRLGSAQCDLVLIAEALALRTERHAERSDQRSSLTQLQSILID